MKRPHRRRFLHLSAGVAALPAISRVAQAQSYPTRPITVVVPYAAGGASDVMRPPTVTRSAKARTGRTS